MSRSMARSVSPVVEGLEGLAEVEVVGLLEAHARRQAVGGERAADVGEQRQRLVGLAAAVQQARQRDGGVGAAGLELERAAQRRLVALGHERVGLAGDEPVEEALDRWRAAGRRRTRRRRGRP